MAIRVFRVAVVGCPRLVITNDPTFSGVGKSCLCNRFVRPEAYTEAHDSTVSTDNWTEKPAYNGDHFLYWGAASKYVGEGAKIRFQVIEQTEFCELVGTGLQRLRPHPSDQNYLQRATCVRVASQSPSKTAYQTNPEGAYATSASSTQTVRSTQLFPNDDFGGAKGQGVCAYVCVFDPTLVGEEMTRQKDFLTELLLQISKTKKRMVLACVKCDAVDEGKRRLGYGLANSVLKKPIPYIETSARESINVDEVFFIAATGSAKKKKGLTAGKHSTSSFTYKEGADTKKQDTNQARDAYRRLLMRKVTHFSCLWNDILPVLEVEPEYNHLLKIGGEEAREVVKKMFCMRLIELKIKEANEQFRLNTIKKKLDNGQQKAFQSYLSDAFKQHPDMGPDFLTDCIPSGRSTPSYTAHTQVLENGGTHSSTPDQAASTTGTFHFPSGRGGANPSPLPSTPSEYEQLALPSVPSGASPTGPVKSPTTPAVVPLGSSVVSSSSLSAVRMSQQVLLSMGGSPVLQHRSTVLVPAASPVRGSPPANSRQPPPIPSRHSTPFDAQSNGSASRAQPNVVPVTDTEKRMTRPFSNSMDCLLGPLPKPDLQSEAATETDPIDAQPYLNPRDLGLNLGPLPPSPAPSPPPRPRGANQFRSLRVIKPQSRPQIPNRSNAVGDVSRTLSLRGHKRSHSNPGLLEGSGNPGAQTLPTHFSVAALGNGGNFASITAAPSATNDNIPIESSLHFAHSEFQRNPLAEGARDGGSAGVGATGNGDDSEGGDEDDNQSELSGPFEEIDERQPAHEGPSSEASNVKTPNHYALIEDYVTMKSVEPLLGAEPAPQQHQNDDSDARRSTFSPFSRQFTKTKSKGTLGEMSPPSTQETQASPQHQGTSPLGGEHNASSTSLWRALPPSPDKQAHAAARKVSNINIYEVIDESWAGKQQRGGAGWTSAVDPSHYQQYEEVVKEFFRDPVVTQQWWSAVRKVVPTGDMAAFPPPFFQAPPSSSTQGTGAAEAVPLLPLFESTSETMATSDLPAPADEAGTEPGLLTMKASIVRSRDDMIGFINQQLNQSVPSDSDDDQSDDREGCHGEFSGSESEDETGTDSDLDIHATSSATAAAVPATPTAPIGLLVPPLVPSSPAVPPSSPSASPSPSLSPPRDTHKGGLLDQPQVSEKRKKPILGVGWSTDLDLMSSSDQLSNLSEVAKGQTDVSMCQSHALEADDSESEC